MIKAGLRLDWDSLNREWNKLRLLIEGGAHAASSSESSQSQTETFRFKEKTR